MPSARAACSSAYDGDTGKIVWSIPLHEQMGLLSTYGGRTNYPIIFEDLVILGSVVIGWGDMATPAHRFIGFDKATGQIALVRQHAAAPAGHDLFRARCSRRSAARSC